MGLFSYRKGLVSFSSGSGGGGGGGPSSAATTATAASDQQQEKSPHHASGGESNNNKNSSSSSPTSVGGGAAAAAALRPADDDEEAQRTLAEHDASTSSNAGSSSTPKVQVQHNIVQQDSSSSAPLNPSRSEETDVEHFGHDYDLPRLRGFHLWHRKWSLFGYATFILFCNLAAPCILYYVLHDHSSLSEHALLGIATATLGISSSFDNPFRHWKLWKHRDLYGPLNDPGPKWHLDFTMHLYSFSLFPIFAIPLAIATSVPHPMYKFFNMATPMLVATPGLFFFISLFKPKAPCWISSDPPGTIIKPGLFYLFEDIGAVDFRHGKPFREALHARYRASPIYRDMFWWLTIFWVYGCTFYFAIVAAVNWTLPFGYSFGLILGLLFLWLVTWMAMSIYIAKYFQKKEQEWLEFKKRGDAKLARAMTLEGAHELALEEGRRRRESRRSSSRRPNMVERSTSTSTRRGPAAVERPAEGEGEGEALALQRTASPEMMGDATTMTPNRERVPDIAVTPNPSSASENAHTALHVQHNTTTA